MIKKEGAAVSIETTAAKDKIRKKGSDPVVYIGPSFKGVISGTVFIGGITLALQKAIEQMPVIAELVVPVANVVKAKKELLSADSALNRFYKAAMTYQKGE